MEKEVYFHVGTERTGTTFLQHRIFPKFDGIYYIRKNEYKNAIETIQATAYSSYLVSHEFERKLEQNVILFAQALPETKPIIVFRRHDDYIKSQYRRYVKNGYKGCFTDFFDLHNDTGVFKKQDLYYCNRVDILERYFNHKPIILSYEDLKQDSIAFIKKLAEALNVSIDFQKTNLNKKHTSYSDKQLKTILYIGRYVNLKKKRIYKNGILHFFYRIYRDSIRYSALHISKLIPNKFFSSEPLIAKNDLDEVRNFYRKDWERCFLEKKLR